MGDGSVKKTLMPNEQLIFLKNAKIQNRKLKLKQNQQTLLQNQQKPLQNKRKPTQNLQVFFY